MSHVQYNSKRLIPAPFVAINKQYEKTGDGQIIGSIYSLVITGKCLAWKGSPDSTGAFWSSAGYPADENISENSRLGAILRKQEGIRKLFSQQGLSLEFQSADGTTPLKCYPRIISVDFSSEVWNQYFNYTITCEADVVYGLNPVEDGFVQYLSEASESWSFDTDEDRPETIGIPRTYRVTHSISARGKSVYNASNVLIKPAWQWARDWALPRMGFDSTIALSSGVNNLPSYYGAYNNVRNEQIDELGGNYSITETFVLASGQSIEEFTVSARTSLDTGLTSITIDGQITGLEERNNDYSLHKSKYDNAVSKFNTIQSLFVTRAQGYSGTTVNATPTSTSVGRNPLTGIINYTYEYNDRPSNLITGARSEVISVQDNWGVDAFAPIFVLGRALGPVIQNLGTRRERTRNLTIEVVMPVATGTVTNRLYTSKPTINSTTLADIQNIVNAMNPVTFGGYNVNVSEQNQSWDGQRFTYNCAWVYEMSNPLAII